MFLASQENVNLSASVYWVPEQGSNSYLNYGAGISEVEIDLITGAITILRSDLVYDCGMSLNPAVDLGQVFLCFLFVFSRTCTRAADHYIMKKVFSLLFLLYYKSFIFCSFNICFKFSFSLMQRYTALLMFKKNIFILEINRTNKGQ